MNFKMQEALKEIEQLLVIRKLNQEIERWETEEYNKCEYRDDKKIKMWFTKGSTFDLENETSFHLDEAICKYLELREQSKKKESE